MEHIPIAELWFERFSLNGAGSDYDLNVDGSGTDKKFRVVAPTRETVHISRIILYLIDKSMRYTDFAGLGAALTNGIEVKAYDKDDNLLIDFLDGTTIKTNADFALLAATDVIITPQPGDDFTSIRWSLFKAGAHPYLEEGQYLEINIQDNLTLVTTFKAIAQGHRYPAT